MKTILRKTAIKASIVLFVFSMLSGTLFAQTSARKTTIISIQDTVKASDIKLYLKSSSDLLYPLATGRMYENGYKPVWFSHSTTENALWDALMLLDCSLQFGLNHHDYHADQLTYSNLREIASHKDLQLAARLDVLLTDAMLAFISHLHYGKLNSLYTSPTTDQADFRGFRADSTLKRALVSRDFGVVVADAQPTYIGYQELQTLMRLITGQYIGDSYEVSAETVKLIAVNLERWRWEKPENKTHVSINIPSFTLRYIHEQNYQEFKVVVGKPSSPTPVLSSTIGYFTTAPDRTVSQKSLLYDRRGNTISSDPINLIRVKSNIADYIIKQSPACDNALGRIAFNFSNNYNIYLHDTPDRNLFDKTDRAFSNRCISMENPEEFAKLLLKADHVSENTFGELHHAMENYQKKRFTLKTPVPVHIRYITCEMKDGLLEIYKDVYQQDKKISNDLFGSNELLITEIKEFIKKKELGFNYQRSPVAQK